MKLKEIYKNLGITPNLGNHMMDVAAVAGFIKDHWIGDSLDWDKLLKAVLVHDVGNIVRFDFEKHASFLGDEQKNVDYWKEVQKKVVGKYGTDDHAATEKMLREIGFSPEFVQIVADMSLEDAVGIAEGDNWYSKILLYSDMRVMPRGISTLMERLEDIRERLPKYSTRPDFEQLIKSCFDIEKQVGSKMNATLEKISAESIHANRELYLETNI